MKTSCIATVLNEEKTIGRFLDSILSQSVLPTEVVITDGGSRDKTVERCKVQVARFKEKGIDLVVKSKKGNRSVGRNEAIRLATHDIILITDAGCELDRNWVKEITKPFQDKTVDVVSGYYEGKAETVFETCLIPYVLVMPDRVDPKTFLPATRSMAIRKKLFLQMGGFVEKYSHNEDYVFANRLKDLGVPVVFQKTAIVYWYPRSTPQSAYHMFWRFAYGDAEAGILRRKVILLISRYVIAGSLILDFVLFKQAAVGLLLLLSLTGYILWAIAKNYRYTPDFRAFFYLPFLQFLSDAAVISGTI
jgi:glycosyltransferase involved in cell wall biosynthesis